MLNLCMPRRIVALCTVLVSPVCALAAQEASRMVSSSSAGEYVVYVLRHRDWREVGALSFDQDFRSKELDLGGYVSGGANVKVRLVQNGGGAAHIDAAFVGNKAPAEVKGIDDRLALKKLSTRDFDVVDAFDKSVELVFPSAGTGTVLSLTARVEGTRISETPFQFPLGNLYREMTGDSEFYRYSLMTKGGGAATTESSERPLFQAYSVTGTGHPSGFTYGWVRNDADNLYVTLDFTPDDTTDGGKDYAKVYVKTAEGLREFKVSVPETKWGRAKFTYTDNVAYQHKVYHFRIPLKDTAVEGVGGRKGSSSWHSPPMGLRLPLPSPVKKSPTALRWSAWL